MKNGLFALVNLLCLLCVIFWHIPAGEHSIVLNKLGTLVIPLFSMIAGYSWGNVLRKTGGIEALSGINLFVVPYLFWTVVYYVANDFVLDIFIRHQPYVLPSVHDSLSMIFLGGTALHLWFLAYLIYAIIVSTLVYRYIRKNWLKYSLFFAVSIFMLIPSSLHTGVTVSTLDYVVVYGFWLIPNFLLGLLFSIKQPRFYEKLTNKRAVLLVSYLLGIVPFILFDKHGAETILSIAVLMTCLCYPKVKMPRLVQMSMEYSMGIYLVHALYAALFSILAGQLTTKCFVFPFNWLVSIVIFVLSLCSVIVMRRIPFCRNFA